MPPPPGTAARAAAPARAVVFVFTVALVVRLAWLAVQHPADAIFADMAGYIERARGLVRGRDAEVCFPPGAHWFYGAQMALFGGRGLAAMGAVQAVAGALVAPAALLLARRCLPEPRAALVVGLAVAVWHPLVVFTGYFSSEVPFALLLGLGAWSWVRWVQTGRGAVVTGTLLGLAYLVRPPVLVGVALLVAWALWRGVGTWRGRLAVIAPVLLLVGLGAARLHDRTGRWGLVSDNGAVASFFAWTDYRGLHATPPPGTPKRTQRAFHPPSRNRHDYLPDFQFKGLRCDPEPLLRERDRVIAASSVPTLLGRAWRNTVALYGGNKLWPEASNIKGGPRRKLIRGYAAVFAFGVLPLAGLGVVRHLAGLRSPPGGTPGEAARGHGRASVALLLLGITIASAAYTGEVRYRVPYDPLLLLLAAYGAGWAVAGARRLVERARGAHERA